MENITFVQLIPIMNFAGMAILAAFIIFLQWKSAKAKVTDEGLKVSAEVIATYKEQVTLLRAEVTVLTSKVGELTGALAEKEKQNKALQDLLLYRNSDLEEIIKGMKTFMPQVMLKLDAVGKFTKNATEELHAQTEILKKQ